MQTSQTFDSFRIGRVTMRKRMLLAETRRLIASRLFVILILALVSLEVIAGFGTGTTANKAIHDGTSTPNLSFLAFISNAGLAVLFVTFLSIVFITKEFASGSILRNSINAGSPERLLVIKMVVTLVAGAIFALIELAIGLIGSFLWANKEHFTLTWNGHLALVCTRAFIAVAFSAPMAVAMGWLGKREKPTIWIFAAYSVVVVPVVGTWLPLVYEWLPSGAGTAIEGVIGVRHFGLLAGLALNVAWLTIFVAGGNALMKKRGLV